MRLGTLAVALLMSSLVFVARVLTEKVVAADGVMLTARNASSSWKVALRYVAAPRCRQILA